MTAYPPPYELLACDYKKPTLLQSFTESIWLGMSYFQYLQES